MKLRREIANCIHRYNGWEAVMRVRISRGWKISNFFGHMLIRIHDLLTVPNCHQDLTFSITLEMEDKVMTVDNTCCIQSALLYTNAEGERRIRVHTFNIVASNNHQELMQSVDPQAAAMILTQL